MLDKNASRKSATPAYNTTERMLLLVLWFLFGFVIEYLPQV
jgi:hypothetical protein